MHVVILTDDNLSINLDFETLVALQKGEQITIPLVCPQDLLICLETASKSSIVTVNREIRVAIDQLLQSPVLSGRVLETGIALRTYLLVQFVITVLARIVEEWAHLKRLFQWDFPADVALKSIFSHCWS